MGTGFTEGILQGDGSFRFSAPADDFQAQAGDYVLVRSGDQYLLGQVEGSELEFVPQLRTRRYTQSLSSFEPGGSTVSDETHEMVPRWQCAGAGRALAGLQVSDGAWSIDLAVEGGDHEGPATIRRAPDEAVESFLAAVYAVRKPLLRVGSLLGVGSPLVARIVPQGLNRPTGLFGQTGSGKSYALGILVEELVLQTKVNVVVLDPNGDLVRFKQPLKKLSEINDGTNRCRLTDEDFHAYQQMHTKAEERVALLSTDRSIEGSEPIILRPGDLDRREIASALRMDPVRDEDEYHLLQSVQTALAETEGEEYHVKSIEDGVKALGYSGTQASANTAARLLRRLRNVAFDSLRIWGSDDGRPMLSILRDDSLQAVIIDLSGLDRLEKALLCSVVLRTVFELQGERRRRQGKQSRAEEGGGNHGGRQSGDTRGIVVVLDEAHHLFPQRAVFPEQELTVEWGTRIAGEGRKYGLYLIVASQLPSKLHEHVLTQCGNVVLMKMASQSDIDALKASLSFVPGALMDRSKWFRNGEALVIGDVVPVPSLLVHFEGRKTQEGGRDVEADW